MKARAWFGSVLVVACLAELWVISSQHRQLAGLRGEEERLMAQRASETKNAPPSADQTVAEPEDSSSRIAATPELLRLRGEVTRLEARRRELASVSAQNASLRTQVATQGTNAGTGIPLPPGYVRTGEARLVGYGSPQDTIQSLLWAVRNKSSAHFLQAFSPELAQQFQTEGAFEKIFQDADQVPGMALVESHQMEDGSVEAKLEVVPDSEGPPVKFRQINGEWKIVTGL
jgi:hypothetical protein